MQSRDLHALRNRLAVALGYARLLAGSTLTSEQRAWTEAIIDACDAAEYEKEVESTAESSWLRPLIAALTDDTVAPQAVEISRSSRAGSCSICGNEIDAPATTLNSPKPMTLSEASALLEIERDAIDAIHRRGGHVRVEIGTGRTTVVVWHGTGSATDE